MVGQNDVAQAKKRKNLASPKSERKRKRSVSKSTEPVDNNLLRILTGDDDENSNRNQNGSSLEQDENKQNEESIPAKDGVEKQSAHADIKDKTGDSKSANPSSLQLHNAWLQALPESKIDKIKVTVLLERANLETVKQPGRTGGHVLLNSDDHRHILRKTGRDANDARPDITHQCLLALMDSPLNKAGRLKVYIRTAKNVLIDVHPQTRVPRTMKRFSGLMAELLEKLKVRGTSGSTPLFRVIKNPITAYLPVGTRRVVCTYNTENVIDMRAHAGKMSELIGADEDSQEVNVLYVIGAMAHGKITEDWADDYICVSEYPLSAATVCSRITYAYECLFGIL